MKQVMIMKVKIETLTPIWTGDINGTCDRIHETSIIGSMRWWYEAIVRGLGGYACDPSQHECPDKDGNYCDVCKVFGATGWRRRFRVEVVEDKTNPIWNPPRGTLNIRPPDRNHGWFLPPGRMGEVTLCFTGDERTLDLLAALFLFLEKWGSLGAKPQLGYGVFEIVNRDEIKVRATRYEWSIMGISSPSHNKPDMRRIGFFRYNFQPKSSVWWKQVPGVGNQAQPIVTAYKTVPVTPALKNEWRFRRWAGNRGDEKWIFGTLQWKVGDEIARVRSKVATSWAYPQDSGWMVRGWGWLQKPKIANMVWDLLIEREAWENVIQVPGSLETHPAGTWREWMAKDVAQFLEEAK